MQINSFVVLNNKNIKRINTHMRIQEITTIKPIQLLTPAKARVNALKQAKDRAADALATERDSQKKANALQKAVDAQQTLAKLKLGGN